MRTHDAVFSSCTHLLFQDAWRNEAVSNTESKLSHEHVFVSLSETSSFIARIVNTLSLLKHVTVKAAVARKVSVITRYIFLLLLGCLPCRLPLTSEYYTAEIQSKIEPIYSVMLCRSTLLKRKGVNIFRFNKHYDGWA